MSTQNNSPLSPRTKYSRKLLRDLLIVSGAVVLAFLFWHAYTHGHKSLVEKQSDADAAAAAHGATGQPDSLASALEAQRRRAAAEAGSQPQAASQPTPSLPVGSPQGSGPLPTGYGGGGIPTGAPGAGLSDAERMALQRGAEAMDDSSTLMIYEQNKTGQADAPGETSSPANTAMDALKQQLNDQLAKLRDVEKTGGDAAGTGRIAIDGNAIANLPAAYASALGAGQSSSLPGSASKQQQSKWRAGSDTTQDALTALTPTAVDSPYELAEGEPIPTVIEERQTSDMAGSIRAVVDRDVYDSRNGTCVVIPKGTHLVGATNSDVAVGQERMLVAMTVMRFANGSRVQLGSMNSSDPDGITGLTADVNNHFFKIFGSTFLIGGVASWIGSRQGSDSGGTTLNINGGSSSSALAQAGGQAISQTTQTLLQRNMNIQPTLSLRFGQLMTIVTTRRMILPPSLTGGRCY